MDLREFEEENVIKNVRRTGNARNLWNVFADIFSKKFWIVLLFVGWIVSWKYRCFDVHIELTQCKPDESVKRWPFRCPGRCVVTRREVILQNDRLDRKSGTEGSNFKFHHLRSITTNTFGANGNPGVLCGTFNYFNRLLSRWLWFSFHKNSSSQLQKAWIFKVDQSIITQLCWRNSLPKKWTCWASLLDTNEGVSGKNIPGYRSKNVVWGANNKIGALVPFAVN